MDIKILLGKRIKELRSKRKMTQQQLAELIDIDQRNLSNIELGINFSSKSLIKIAEIFNIPVKELFEFEHFKLTNEMKINYISSSLNNLSERDLSILYKMTKFMVS